MTINNADFKVKKGLQVADGDVTLASNRSVKAGTFDTNVAAAGVTLTAVTLSADGTNTDIPINITPKGTGSVVMSKVDIGGGTVDGITSLTAANALDIGAYDLTALTFTSDVASATGPPLIVTSTANVPNLNASYLGGATFAAPGAIGGTTASTGAFTTLSATGAVTATNTVTVGINGTGHDVQFFGATSGKYMLWDESADQMKIIGTANTVTLDVALGDFTVGAYGLTNAGAATIASMAGNWTNTGRTVADAGTLTTVDINGGTVDGATVGASSHTTGKFTTLKSTSTFTADNALTSVVTAGAVSINNADTASPSLNTKSNTQVNGSDKSGGAVGSSLMTSELRLKSDIANDDLGGSWNDYQGDANLLIMENAENQPAGGQGVVFSVGAGGTGSAWATGRLRGGTQTDNIFTIGHRGANWDAVGYKNGTIETIASPLQLAQSRFTINTDGDTTIYALNAKLKFRGHASGDATTVYTTSFQASQIATAGIAYTLPPAAPVGNDYVLTAQTNGTLGWSASSSGADGMGAGFQLEDDDGTEVAITTSKEVKFIGAGITTNWTDTTHGIDTDPYDMTFTLDVDDLGTSANFGVGDLIAFGDTSTVGNDTVKGTVNTLATLFAGTGLTATNAVIGVDAAQTGITSVGALTSLSTAADSTIDLNGGAITIDGTTLSIDSVDTTNLTMTANSSSAKALTIDAINSGVGAASITLGSTSGTAINIGNATSEVTIGDNLTINGDLIVTGSIDTISSTTIVVEDKIIDLGSVATPSDSTANGGGVTLKGATDKTILWDNTNDNWTSNQDWNIATGKKFRINNAAVFESATQLTSTVVTSGLTTVGVLANGSIASGFGTISTGNAITTTAAITGGSLIADNITINGNDISSTNTGGNITFTLDGNGLVTIPAGDLSYAGTAITATGVELNYLDLSDTIGTVTGSQAVVVDASRNLTNIGDVTSTGALQGATLSVDAVAVLDTSRGAAATITGATALASYAVATYKTAKYVYQIKADASVDTDVGEILITHEGTTNDVFITEYGMMSTGSSVGDWSGVWNGTTSKVELKFTPTTNGVAHTYTILNTLLI